MERADDPSVSREAEEPEALLKSSGTKWHPAEEHW